MYLDTRDLEERRQELQEIQDAREEWEGLSEDEQAGTEEPDELTDKEAEELQELNQLEQEIGASTWANGETLIPENEFTTYVQDLAEDIGAVSVEASWIVIDWEATADGVKMDYSEVTYQGETYLVRNC